MQIPIRCFSCGKPIGHLWEKFKERIKEEKPEKVMEDLGLERYCCKAMFIGQADAIDEVAKFKKF